MKYLIVTFIVSILSGCSYNAGYRAGVKLYQNKKNMPYLRAGYNGGIVIGFLEESVRDSKKQQTESYIKKSLDELR